MPFTALKPQVKEIPPDLAAVLGDAAIHPDLLRVPPRPAPPTAATLSVAALALAASAAMDPDVVPGRVTVSEPSCVSLGVKGVIHSVAKGGVLYLKPSSVPRAVTLAWGSLAQHCAQQPLLSPGTVRLVPAGHALTLADLAGEGALAVEVVC